MNNFEITKVIKRWKREAHLKDPVAYRKRRNALTIYTNKPGWLIGESGVLINKYSSILRKETDNDKLRVKIVGVDYYVR